MSSKIPITIHLILIAIIKKYYLNFSVNMCELSLNHHLMKTIEQVICNCRMNINVVYLPPIPAERKKKRRKQAHRWKYIFGNPLNLGFNKLHEVVPWFLLLLSMYWIQIASPLASTLQCFLAPGSWTIDRPHILSIYNPWYSVSCLFRG